MSALVSAFTRKKLPMTQGMPTQAFLSKLEKKRDSIRASAEAMCMEARSQGRDELTVGEHQRLRHMLADMNALDGTITEYRSDLERVGTLPKIGTQARTVSSAGALAPLGFDDEQMRQAFERTKRGESFAMEARDFTTGVPLLPAQLYPVPTFPIHEGRLLDRLPGFSLDAPSFEYIQVNTVTGNAAVVAEGAAKPELDMPAVKVTVAALKLAVHAGISWESINDFDAFTTAVRTELMRKVIDVENQQLVYGTGGTTQLAGMTTTTGILTMTATGAGTPVENYTDFAGAIAALRTGPALATPDLICMHPNTWANLRTQKDNYGRFLTDPDPSQDQASTIFGIDVLQSIFFNAGDAILIDTTKFGRVAVREPLVLRVGYSGTDFTNNILRSVCEERLNLAVERPAAILWLKGLPTAAPTVAETKKK
jgi:HK97 family phage major capsid protein